MAIKSSEYISLIKTSHDVFRKLSEQPEYFYENLDLLRKQWNVIKAEYNNYSFYPRHNMEKFHEAVEIMNEYCSKTDVSVSWVGNTENFNEENWFKHNKYDQIAFFNFEGVNITKLLDFG